jgi:hypothetical protein
MTASQDRLPIVPVETTTATVLPFPAAKRPHYIAAIKRKAARYDDSEAHGDRFFYLDRFTDKYRDELAILGVDWDVANEEAFRLFCALSDAEYYPKQKRRF